MCLLAVNGWDLACESVWLCFFRFGCVGAWRCRCPFETSILASPCPILIWGCSILGASFQAVLRTSTGILQFWCMIFSTHPDRCQCSFLVESLAKSLPSYLYMIYCWINGVCWSQGLAHPLDPSILQFGIRWIKPCWFLLVKVPQCSCCWDIFGTGVGLPKCSKSSCDMLADDMCPKAWLVGSWAKCYLFD